MNITKNQIVREVSQRLGIPREEIKAVLDSTFAVIKKNIVAGNPIFLRGFGSFSRVARKARIARNISKGTFVEVPEHFATKFKPYFDA